MTTGALLNHLRGLRKTAAGWQALCPAHEDRHPSLSIAAADDGRTLLTCHAGCTTEAVVAAMGLHMTDLFLDSKPDTKASARSEVIYPYADADGRLLFDVVRGPGKSFRQRRPDGHGGWIWNMQGVSRVLYRLPEVLAADRGALVFVTEGEKDCDNLRRLGLVATTNPGGAGKWRTEYSAALAGRDVVILPDNDDAGRQHGEAVAAALHGVARSVRVLALPGVAAKGDVTDWLAAGGEAPGLVELARAVPLLTSGLSVGSVGRQAEDQWPEPEEIANQLLPVPEFNVALLPDALRPWIADVADRLQCPIEYPAVGATVSIGSVIGRTIGIRPKRQDDWLVIPNLWGALVGPPSAMKSPALAEALRPLNRLAVTAQEEHQRAVRDFAYQAAQAKAQRSVLDDELKKAAKDGGEFSAELRARFDAVAASTAPTERRYIVNDATVEALGIKLNENPRGLLHIRDELTGWFRSLDREGHENDRSFYIESWDGAGSYSYDRVGRGTLHIASKCVSMLGGIQPGPLADYLRPALRGGHGDDGLVQRFQLLVYPDAPSDWRNIDRWPDSEARNRAFEIFQRLNGLSAAVVGAEVRDGNAFLRFDEQGQALFNDWRTQLERRTRSGEEHHAMEAHLTKYRKLMPGLALIFHLVDVGSGPVDLASAARAAAWCDLMEAHARRVYSLATGQDVAAARRLLAHARAGRLTSPFGAREVQRHGWAGLTTAEQVEPALRTLEEHGWLKRAPVATAGRTRIECHLHPAALAKKAA